MAKKIKDPRPSWDEYFMEIATVVSKRSNCMRRSVGAVVMKDNHILSTGYNGTPRGVKNCFRLQRHSARRQELLRRRLSALRGNDEKRDPSRGMPLHPRRAERDLPGRLLRQLHRGRHDLHNDFPLPHLREAHHQLRHKGGRLWWRLRLHRQGEGDVQGGRGEAQEV